MQSNRGDALNTAMVRQRLSRRAVLGRGGGVGVAMLACRVGQDAAAGEETPAMGSKEGLPSFPAAEQHALEEIVARQLAVQAIPGVVAGVWVRDRGAWTHAAGVGDVASGAPIALDDHFRIASVSKTFVATAILQLVDAGELSLEDTLEPFVPGIPNGARITVRQLLGMTAGVFNFVNDPTFEEAYTRDPLADITPAQEIAIMRQHPADFPPGAKTQYSDSNYVLLGGIIEQVTGESVGEVIRTRVLDPLQLSHTSYPKTPEMPEPYAHGYAAATGSDELREVTRSNPAVANAAGAMISTLDDLRVWSKALVTGTLLTPQTQAARLETSPLPSRLGLTAGYGLGILEVNGFFGHNGAIFGYSTWMLHGLAQDATIVVLANRGETETEFAGPIALEIAHLLFPEQFPREPSGPSSATPAA
jgi:D-alanyl-D-alanine carboxypeptidase